MKKQFNAIVGFKSAAAFLAFILGIILIVQQQYPLSIAFLLICFSEFTFVFDRIFPQKKNDVE